MRKDILAEIVAIRERMLGRCLELQRIDQGAVSEEEIDLKRIDLLEARLRATEEVP